MNRRAILILGIVALILFSFSLGTAQRSAVRGVAPIPADKIVPIKPPVATGAKDYCFLDYTDWTAAYYHGQWKYGDKVAIYFDPEECGWPENYPFQLTDVEFALYDFAAMGACSLRFSVEVMCPDICDGPGIEIWKSRTYNITTFYPDIVTIYFEDTVCLDKPFFFNVEYLQGPQGMVPSLLFDEQVVDTCYQWVWTGQPAWWEWYDFWYPYDPPGWVLLGISGYCGEEQTDCGWWYWKPDTTEAPSGMPDFDQNQPGWSCYCGPTAVANCLWWFNAVPPGWTPPQLIDTLARYFHTSPVWGTYVDTMQMGLEEYFADYGFALTETTYWMPDFYEMEDSLKVCQDIILLLGFWWYEEEWQEFIRGDVNEDGLVNVADYAACLNGPPFSCDDAVDVNDDGVLDNLDCDYLYNYLYLMGPPPPPPFPDCGLDPTTDALGCADYPECPGGGGGWYREGGHFVTMAGVNSEKKEIAISDPDRDQCVQYPWWPGRVRPPTHPLWGGYPPTLHNNPTFVSHDVYISLLYPEFPSPGSEVWDLADYCYEWYKYANMNVPERFKAFTKAAPKHYEYWHTEVEAAVMICPKPPPDTLRNHFKTWRIEPEPFWEIVFVQDQFMSDSLILDTIDLFSNPVKKDTFEIADSLEHLTWYRAHGRDTLLEVEYSNQFGTDTVRIDSVKYLLLPTAKEPYPSPESLDHYKAYRIKDPVAFERTLVLEDQFDRLYDSVEFIDSLKPIYFLTPALKNKPPPVFDSVTHYVAYEIFPKRFFPLPVNTFDQFGPHLLQVDTSKILLVPTRKLRAEPPPNDPPEIIQPDTLYGYKVCDTVVYTFDGIDPDGDPILDAASLVIEPSCGTYSVTRLTGHGTSTGTWEVTWETIGCQDSITYKIIVDLTDDQGNTAWCTTYCHLDPNHPPVIDQPDFIEGYVNDVVEYDISGTDPDGDVILDDASISIQPDCGSYSITRTSGSGTSSGTWHIRWQTDGCTACDTHTVIHDLTDGCDTSYCTTYVHLSEQVGWHWKDPYEDYAPNGMPDIDQRQDAWVKFGTDQFSFCGPVAVANCFKWFDSKYNVPPGFPGDGIDMFPLVRDYMDNNAPMIPPFWDDHDPYNVDHPQTPWNAACPPPPTNQPFSPGPQPQPSGMPPWGELVERLACFFNTDGCVTGYCDHTGTNVMEMQAGIDEWLESERFPDAEQMFIRGDVNEDGVINTADIVTCANGPPFSCDDAADVNDDGVLNMADCVYLTNFISAGGPPPPLPYPNCGVDLTPDGLDCATYPPCPFSNTLADTLCEVTTPMPTFAYVESLVEKCEDVILLLGFWFEENPQEFIRGDVNEDGIVNVADIAACVNGPPFSCDDAADVNDDGVLDMVDCIYLEDYLYYAGPPPPPPFPDCGPDPSPDQLGCADFPPCPGGGGEWRRIGGHYVTVAGVNSQAGMIAFSDPFIDAFELGIAPGRVGDGSIIPHPHGSHDPTVHNDEGNVSHDMYYIWDSPSPGGLWGLPEYAIMFDPLYWSWNFFNQNVPDEFVPVTAPWNEVSPIFTEVEYCVHISPWDYRGDVNGDGVVDLGDVVYLIRYLYRGGPPPVPYTEGDVTCNGIVDLGDVVFLISYLYRNGPVPRCCDP